MPNWVCNHLIIHGENAVEVMNSLLSENSESENGCDIDFNKIIPMPEDLKIESGSVTRDCAKLYVNAMLEGCDAYKKYAALYVQAFGKDLAMSEDEQRKTMEYVMLHKDYEKNCPMFQTKADAYAYGKKALDNYEKYGAKDWYDWSIQNWGTKWNAHDTIVNDPSEANVYFNTAWSAPLSFLDALSQKYPELTFDFEFADEDIGYNTGKMTIRDGEILEGGFLEDAAKKPTKPILPFGAARMNTVSMQRQAPTNISTTRRQCELSTRSYICVKQDDGSYKGVYCHWDGYLTYNGAMLIDHYNSLEKANEILALGDISSLKENLYPDPAKGPHSFDYGKQQEGVTIAYGRDRGETGTEAKTVDLKTLQSDDSWIDYIYVFEDGRWKYFEYGQLSEGLKDVDEDLHEYYASKGVKRPENFYGYLTDEGFAELRSKQMQAVMKKAGMEM